MRKAVRQKLDSYFSKEECHTYLKARLPGLTFNGHRNVSVHCLFHDDSNPSFSVNPDEGIFNCHGCGEKGGLQRFEELYSRCDPATARENVYTLVGRPQTKIAPPAGQPEAIYEYFDEHRNLLFRKMRFPGKRIIAQRPVGQGWVSNLDGITEKPLYGLPDLITADTVFVAEGEKDCDSLRNLHLEKIYPRYRFAYVTNHDGAGHWRKPYTRFFHGKFVIVFADNDEAGRKHARDIVRSLTGIATEIKLVEFPELPEKGDVSNWIEQHSDNEGDPGFQLWNLIKRTSIWQDDARAEWTTLFHSYDDLQNAPPIRFAIEGFLQEDGITAIGAPPENAKTLTMLAMARALLEGGKLFHHFQVNRIADRVLYLIPECGISPFVHRLRLFRLMDYIRDQRLFCRTLSASGRLSLKDPQLHEAVKGADVFLDTAVRFMEGDENSSEQREFAELLFNLQRAGARTITAAHHSPKSFGKDNYMALENVLRGSGDIGAMLVACWGLSQIDKTNNRVYVQNCKARDFAPSEPFILQGRPSIDETGYFELSEPPGFAGDYADVKPKPGRPPVFKDSKYSEAVSLKNQGLSIRDIANKIGVSKSTVSNWFKDDENEPKVQ